MHPNSTEIYKSSTDHSNNEYITNVSTLSDSLLNIHILQYLTFTRLRHTSVAHTRIFQNLIQNVCGDTSVIYTLMKNDYRLILHICTRSVKEPIEV